MPSRAILTGALLACLALPATSHAIAVRGPGSASNDLRLRYSPRHGGRLTGRQSIDFANRGPAALSTVWLRLWANGPGGCRRSHISLTVEPPATAGPARVNCTALPVTLARPLAPGARTTIRLRFVVRSRRVDDRFGRSGGALLFGNVIPILAVTDELGTHLEPYVSDGESFYSLTARWHATFSLPATLRAATTGAVVSDRVAAGRRLLTVGTPAARDFALAVGRFRVTSGRVGGVRVRVFTRRRRGHGRSMLRDARRALRLFASRFGPYGSRELDVVRVSDSWGMEYPELVFTGADEATIAHEISHQWWYGLVGNNEYREPWLDESFASYSDSLAVGGFDWCDPRRPFATVPRFARHERLDQTMAYFGRDPLAYSSVVYDAGACSLRSLERSLGRSRMRSLLRLVVARYRRGVITKSDFLKTVGEVAPPGFDMPGFLRRAHLSS